MVNAKFFYAGPEKLPSHKGYHVRIVVWLAFG